MKKKSELPGWKSLPAGGIITEAGSSLKFETGDWRSERPVHKMENCTHCLRCWIVCPDSAVKVKDDKFDSIDYRYCKGCGICWNECPAKVNAIEMKPEADFR